MVLHRSYGWSILVGSVAIATCVGCGGSNDSGTSPTDSNTTSASAAQPSAASAAPATAVSQATPSRIERHQDPKVAVTQFLTALKSGDQARATAMLSAAAQTEMARSDAVIQPPGSPTAEFQVTEVEYLGEQQEGAHVWSVWKDVEADGAVATHEIVWILRRESQGWAIAGFATTVFEDQDPLILSFEDPADLKRKRAAVDDEIARRNAPAAPQQADLR